MVKKTGRIIGTTGSRRLSLATGILALPALVASATPGRAASQVPDPWQVTQEIQPEDLAKVLASPAGERPVVLYVGFQARYRNSPIVGARPTGPASEPDGAQGLRRALQGLPRDRKVVLFFGCCPWADCPNIRTAFRIAQDAGFQQVQVLVLPKSFPQDWTDKGYPVQTGEAGQ
jgi:hypothetical protein